jgi:hypothetical protein
MEHHTHRSHQLYREWSLVAISTQDLSSSYGPSENNYLVIKRTSAHSLGFRRLGKCFCISLSFQFKLSAIVTPAP